ncbi:MAG: hypothetical protein K2X08_03905, partial [Chlamydiales bacterium]|nr:hypothetical protein [Chlamydiales bacterium]
MELLKKCIKRAVTSFILVTSVYASTPIQDAKMQALYLMQQQKIEESIERYRDLAHLSGRHDFDLLQQMGLILLQKGIRQENPQAFLMTLFGAGFSNSARSLEILEKGLEQPD